MNSSVIDLKYQEIKKSVHYIIDRLQQNGFAGCIAGGAVRDILLGKKPNDFDILTNASLDEIKSVFFDQKVKKVGKTFPVCIVNGIEVSSARTDYDRTDYDRTDYDRTDYDRVDYNMTGQTFINRIWENGILPLMQWRMTLF